jgi:DNA sulfur modification protein DndD
MIFTKFVLENYGLFSGRNEFDLSPRTRKGKQHPIILFGGKNGAGKTTFLGALRLLFYGRKSLDGRPGQKEYEEALLGRAHRNKLSEHRSSYAKVGLGFDHVTGGEKASYYVERSWSISRQGAINEYFKVEKNGSLLEDVGPDHWEAFVSDLVPERLSQLFFFDGEKIKSIAEDQSSNEAISEAIQSLLGLDAVISLKADLSIYKSRLLKSENLGSSDRDLEECLSDIEKLKVEQDGLAESLPEISSKLDGIISSITNLEASLQQRGGTLAQERGKNLERQKHFRSEVEKLESGVREACDGAAPFVLCPGITKSLTEQLNLEEAGRNLQTKLKTIDELRSHLIQKAEGPTGQAKSIRQFLEQQIDSYLARESKISHSRILHALSDRASHALENLLTSIAPEAGAILAELLQKLDDAHQSLIRIQRDLDQTPDEKDLADLLSNLNVKLREKVETEHLRQQRLEEKRQLGEKMAALERQRLKLEQKLASSSKHREKLQHLERVVPALEEYRRRLAQAKIETLQDEVTKCFNSLARKDDFIRRISVDATSFAVTLYDKQDRPIPKEELSSGEKQIFAIALLWGLARTSGRPLPVVIDTPLGRLDSDHRSTLIKNYFPNAGHQVILLSTDTEVDQALFAQLSPAVSHCYHLEYENNEGRTRASEEYFWKPSAA